MLAQVYFDGEYRIEDGEWQKIVEGEHIPSTQGDVTLRGNFHMLTPDGEYVGIYRGEIPIAFYTDHINITFYEDGCEPCDLDTENPIYGSSACGAVWNAHTFMSDSDKMIEIRIHNPHAFGNETAIDELIASVTLWAGIDFEKGILDSGATQRNIGLLFVFVSLMLLGIALFSTLIHLKNAKVIWILGIVILFAGIYFAYSASGVSFWSDSVVSNTTILGASMILYMFFFEMIITYLLERTRRVANYAVSILGVVDAVFFLIPVVTDVLFYDIWIFWIAAQLLTNVIFMICLFIDLKASTTRIKWLYVGGFLPLIAFAVDVVGTWIGAWKGGVISQYVFIALFAVAMIMVLNLITHNINAAAKARELELEK
ncbi:MAG: sulfite exporter TauE/SafE family protein, partial [Clostridia bacterium]|nr:sulfite exporter TauE/SafE family protein [Clostridia bacterium]